MAETKRSTKDVLAQIDDHEKRLSELERNQEKLKKATEEYFELDDDEE